MNRQDVGNINCSNDVDFGGKHPKYETESMIKALMVQTEKQQEWKNINIPVMAVTSDGVIVRHFKREF